MEGGADSSAYAPASPGTAPWGFADSSEPLVSSEAMWQEACRLGPTDLDAIRPVPFGGLTAPVEDTYAPESVVGPPTYRPPSC